MKLEILKLIKLFLAIYIRKYIQYDIHNTVSSFK